MSESVLISSIISNAFLSIACSSLAGSLTIYYLNNRVVVSPYTSIGGMKIINCGNGAIVINKVECEFVEKDVDYRYAEKKYQAAGYGKVLFQKDELVLLDINDGLKKALKTLYNPSCWPLQENKKTTIEARFLIHISKPSEKGVTIRKAVALFYYDNEYDNISFSNLTMKFSGGVRFVRACSGLANFLKKNIIQRRMLKFEKYKSKVQSKMIGYYRNKVSEEELRKYLKETASKLPSEEFRKIKELMLEKWNFIL